ncbi:hypothetical protein J6590_039049 [Homalodisca vitripennis]|nr:hypothetical protein J6590_039049 [Homalodisca vitripennis]
MNLPLSSGLDGAVVADIDRDYNDYISMVADLTTKMSHSPAGYITATIRQQAGSGIEVSEITLRHEWTLSPPYHGDKRSQLLLSADLNTISTRLLHQLSQPRWVHSPCVNQNVMPHIGQRESRTQGVLTLVLADFLSPSHPHCRVGMSGVSDSATSRNAGTHVSARTLACSGRSF